MIDYIQTTDQNSLNLSNSSFSDTSIVDFHNSQIYKKNTA